MKPPQLLMWVILLSGVITLLLLQESTYLNGQTPTKVDATTQIKNPPAVAIIQQTTQLPTFFEDGKRVTAPTFNQPCAIGTWALDQSHFYLCLEPMETKDYRWIRFNINRLSQ